MSTGHGTAPRAAAKAPRARTARSNRTTPGGATAAGPGRRRNPLARAVRNVGIALDTVARVTLLGRDGVRY
ncbi:hypothetical protein OG689_18770 [Kitasatospora sp. NBC_00240]|jgi:DNA-binding protein H-NS|uniref:Uncharacterized protein n=1 Tax=Kitasatospora herbaricolor TaxID=68217 RepID=A0ABZ1W954_9ACTN|nr:MULTISPECIES: hypothetical protein [Kitasatospora]MCX5211308.1 hypothetical protein [Kitasatospora sp. NBC_00240]